MTKYKVRWAGFPPTREWQGGRWIR